MALVFGALVGDNVVVSIQPPNQPYLTHEVVGSSEVDVDDVVELVVVVSSRQPANISDHTRVTSGIECTYPTTQASCKFQSV